MKINRLITSVVTKGVGDMFFVWMDKNSAAVAAPNSHGRYWATVVNPACAKCSEKSSIHSILLSSRRKTRRIHKPKNIVNNTAAEIAKVSVLSNCCMPACFRKNVPDSAISSKGLFRYSTARV